jgi:hypothetical protein
MKKRTEIIVAENIALNDSGQNFKAFCSECRKMVNMPTPKGCAIRRKIMRSEIFRLIEAEQIHFIENNGICPDSVKTISRWFQPAFRVAAAFLDG